jgi:O-antigen/teichoic acid export membrane protein
MRGLLSSSFLLGVGSLIHAMRVIILSFLLGNRDFGAVSTLLLIATLFGEFGSLGFSQLVYNQRLFRPGIIDRALVNVSRFLIAGLSIIAAMALITAIAISSVGTFHFGALLLTLVCAAANVMILAACRASSSKFTHPLGYFLKSLIVLVDIAILGAGHFNIETMVLWGEVLATPVLLAYAWRVGMFRLRWSHFQSVLGLLAQHRYAAFWAVLSSMSALIFFNQERIAGALFLTLEEMGVIAKIILIKLIGAQLAFVLGTHFHRHIVGSDLPKRKQTFDMFRRYEFQAYLALALLCAIATIPVQIAYQWVYNIELTYAAAISAIVLGVVFFFNPYAILLQATGRFSAITRCNMIEVILFVVLTTTGLSSLDTVVASAIMSLFWYVLIRHTAVRTL